MGLNTSHGCFDGPYSQFHRWRLWLALQIGIPLEMMDGFCEHYVTSEEVEDISKHLGLAQYKEPMFAGMKVLRAMRDLPAISWQVIGKDPLATLLHHSDCGGKIRWFEAKAIALRLLQILRTVPNDTDSTKPQRGCYDGMYPCTKRFAVGLARAYKARENVRFG